MPFIPIKQLIDVYTVKDVAELLGVNASTLNYRITAGRFPAPTHKPVGARRTYYTAEDVANFKLAYGKEVE